MHEQRNAHESRTGIKPAFWRELSAIFAAEASKALQRNKSVSEKTQTERTNIVRSSFRQLREMGYRLESPRSFKNHHVQALMHRWEDEGLSASTLQGRLSVLRWFAIAIRKPGLIASRIGVYLKNPLSGNRSYVALADKSWSAKGIDVLAKIEEVRGIDALCAVHLELAYAFGLRQKECVAMRPFEADQGAWLLVSRGTKGGRDRLVPIETPYQREVVDRAKLFAHGYKRTLCARGKSIPSQIDRLSHILRSVGISKKGLGVTMHGLRAQKACDLKEQLTGIRAPVRGGGNHPDPERELSARLYVSEYLGHTRPQITSAYYGSTQKRFQPKPPVVTVEEQPAAAEVLVHMTLNPGGAWRLDIPTTWLPGASQSVGILPAPMGVPPDE